MNTERIVREAGPLITPPGVVLDYAGTSAPEGWALLYGQSLNARDNPVLFSLLGHTYGGSGGNFNLPDLRGRVVAGKDNMGGTSSNRLTAAADFDGDILGGAGGNQANPGTAGAATGEDVTAFEESGGLGSKVQPTLILNKIIKLG